MTESSVCEYCGKELPKRNFALPGHRPMLITMPCECPEALAAREAEERELERNERIAAFNAAWSRARIPERFIHVKADTKAAQPLMEGRSLYIYGENGRGKTHKACQVAKAYLACNTYRDKSIMRCWKSCLFVTAQDVLSQLRTSWDRWDESEEDVFMRFVGADLLILDDLGKGVPSEWAAENLFRVVDRRWAKGRPMVITSQYTTEQLTDRYAKAGDETMGAMLSRLGDVWCDKIHMTGEDKRLANT